MYRQRPSGLNNLHNTTIDGFFLGNPNNYFFDLFIYKVCVCVCLCNFLNYYFWPVLFMFLPSYLDLKKNRLKVSYQ